MTQFAEFVTVHGASNGRFALNWFHARVSHVILIRRRTNRSSPKSRRGRPMKSSTGSTDSLSAAGKSIGLEQPMRGDRNAVIVFVYGRCTQVCEAGRVMAFVRHSFRIL